MKTRTSLNALRKRLTFWYAGTFLFCFVFFIVLAGAIIWRTLQSQIDHHLHAALSEAVRVWHQAPSERKALISALASSQGMVVVVMAPDGQVLLQNASPEVVIPAQHELAQHVIMLKDPNVSQPHHFTVGKLQFALATTGMPGGEGAIGVGYSVTVLRDTFSKALGLLGVATLFLMVILTYLGFLLAKKSQARLLADFTHTLKTPLTILKSSLSSAKGPAGSMTYVNQAIKIVDDLLFLSRLEVLTNLTKENLNLTGLLGQICEMAKVLAQEKKIELRCFVKKDLAVRGDRGKLTRAFLNIFENAICYTQGVGEKGQIELWAKKEGCQVVIKVKDNGRGILKEDLGKIFNRFYRGKNVEGQAGTGLGLSIVWAIIQAHQGTVTIDSQLGQGTTVTITLPAV